MRLVLILAALLFTLPTAQAESAPCAFGGVPLTTFSIVLPAPHPEYTVWTSGTASYEAQAQNADLQSGTLAPRTPLVLAADVSYGLFVRGTEPGTLLLCSGAARPVWQFLPLISHSP